MRSPLRRHFRQIVEGIIFFSIFFLPFSSEVKAESLTLDSIAHEIQTPEALAQFMSKHFLYMEDQVLFSQEEYWQTPEEMLQRKQGDCEDYALFAEAILSRKNYKVFLLSVYGEEDAHTVVVFEKDGKWGILDLDDIRFLKGDSIRDLGNEIKRDWTYLGIMRRDGNRGIMLKRLDEQVKESRDTIRKQVLGVYPFHAVLPDNFLSQPKPSVGQQAFEIHRITGLDTYQDKGEATLGLNRLGDFFPTPDRLAVRAHFLG